MSRHVYYYTVPDDPDFGWHTDSFHDTAPLAWIARYNSYMFAGAAVAVLGTPLAERLLRPAP